MSLGIDLSPQEKCCNFDCIYCELEKAEKTDKILHPPKVEDVIADVKVGLEKYDVDVVTITANGEPTLYKELDSLVDNLNKIKGNKKSLILSNSSNIMKKEIQQALKKLDIVKLSLDAVTPAMFKKIDRPLKTLKINEIIDGIKAFSKIYEGELIIEILVVKGINDKEEEFEALNTVLKEIKPTRIDLSTIDRPPAYDVLPVAYERLFELSHCLEEQNVYIASRKNLKNKKESYNKEELLKTFTKRPFTKDDVENILDESSRKLFLQLFQDGLIQEKRIVNTKFYTAKKELKMKVAFMTNGKDRLAKHIGLAKNIVFYSLPEGEFLQMIENPIMKKIKDENIVIEKGNEGNRRLGVGTEIPRFLKENNVDIFVSYEFGKGIKDNLLALGITPVAAAKQTVDEIVQTMKNNQDKA